MQRDTVQRVVVRPGWRAPQPSSHGRVPPQDALSTRRAASTGSARTSHSHSRTTAQPASSASCVARLSRSWVLAILVSHRPALGPRKPRVRPCAGHPCQKSPSTKTATWRRGSTRSGVQPWRSSRWRRNRAPAACRARRSSSSGSVCLLRRPQRPLLASVETHCSPMERNHPQIRLHCQLRRRRGSRVPPPRTPERGGLLASANGAGRTQPRCRR